MNSFLQNTKYIFLKDLTTELREKSHLTGVFIFVFASFYISYLSFKRILVPATWSALFWIIIIFAALNIASRSFFYESKGRSFYLSTLVSPKELYFGKALFNFILTLIITITGYFIYGFLLGNLVLNATFFLVLCVFASLGFSIILTTSALIAAKANYSFTLMSVISIPLLLPFLITLIKLSKIAVDGLDMNLASKPLLLLSLIVVIFSALSYLFIPYLWRD